MDFLKNPRNQNKPELSTILLRWVIETFGEPWFWANCDWSANFAVIGQKPNKIMAISFDDKARYVRLGLEFGVYDLSLKDGKTSDKLLMPLNIADPAFFDKLKAILVEFTPSTTQDGESSSSPSARETLRTTWDKTNLRIS